MALASLDVGPTGRSISRWVEPAASFFDMIEATICSRVSSEWAFDRDQDVVRWRQIDVPAPDQAAVAGRDDLFHLLDADVDPGQHLHGIRRARRRGNRPRRRLWNGEAVSGDDRHHDHRGAVAGNAADAMFVDDDRAVPAQLGAGPRHRANQRDQFVAGHEARRADQESRDLHVGVAIMRQVIDDLADFLGAQCSALDLAAHGFKTVRAVAPA